jgi:hypothetical protein
VAEVGSSKPEGGGGGGFQDHAISLKVAVHLERILHALMKKK